MQTKRIISCVLVLLMLFSVLTTVSAQRTSGVFNDVPKSHWAYEYVMELSESNVISGYPDGTFRPEAPVTRAEWVKMLCVAGDLMSDNYYADIDFPDVNNDAWYYQYIKHAGYSVPVHGTLEDSSIYFMPDAEASRLDVTVSLVNVKGYDYESVDVSLADSFADSDSIAHIYKQHVASAVQNNLVKGFEDMTFRPNATLTRAEAATLLSRAFNKDDALVVWGFNTDIVSDDKDVFEKYQNKWAKNAKNVGIDQIEWQGGDLSINFALGNYPDVIMKTAFQNTEVAKYANQGILIDLSPYINETDTPNIWKMFEEHPTTKAISTAPDGGIYALPSYSGNPGAFIETFWYINDSWLQRLDLETPTNLDELYEVLKAFKTGDPNGNGIADEIPMTFKNDAAYSYPETLLSCWGVSAKFGMYDAYLNVQDGVVDFAPMMDEWKEMIKYYAKLYNEGLLDIQCFTYDSPQWSSVLRADTPVIGVTFAKENPFGDNAYQYKVMPPLKAHADSPDPVVHIHPGVNGTRNACHVTSACEDPARALKWIDTFYDQEQTITNWYGEAGTGAYDTFTLEGGMYKWRNPADLGYESFSEMYGNNTTFGPHMIGYWDSDAQRGKLVEDCEVFVQYDELYAMYEPYMDLEYSWPRPYYNPEDSTELSNMQADIFATVEKYKAEWILGRSNIDDDWNKYIYELKNLGIDKFININQNAYDVYLDALEKAK